MPMSNISKGLHDSLELSLSAIKNRALAIETNLSEILLPKYTDQIGDMGRRAQLALDELALATVTNDEDPPPPPSLPVPVAPTGLKVVAGNAQLKVSWTASPAGELVEYYEVTLNGTSVGTATLPEYTALNLQNGQPYAVKVRAHNASGDGDYTPAVTSTPVDPNPPPPPPTDGVVAENRPFDPTHPVYQPIPANCPLDQYSSLITAYIATQKSMAFDTGGDSPPIYVGKSTDPVYNLSIAGKSFSVHVPTTAKAGSGVDGPLIILDSVSKIEYRMWQAKVNHTSKSITCSNGGVSCYANDGRLSNGKKALGQAEIHGSNTGSGCSYSVGMIRPIDVKNGRIDHAIRIAAGFLSDHRWNWPATRTEGGSNSYYLTSENKGCPMGARIFLDPSVDVVAVGNAAAAKVGDAKSKAFLKMLVKAIQEFGFITLDGTGGGMNMYFEGDETAGWTGLIGPKNSYGSFNDLARALVSVLPYDKLRVAAPSVFNNYGR